MGVSSVNSLVSLQESQLTQILQLQAIKARAEANAQQKQAQAATDGQNLPGANDQAGLNDQAVAAISQVPMEPLDPALSPENINALLQSLDAQQASLNTTTMMSGSMAGPGGKTLVDYLADPDTMTTNAANDDTAAETLNVIDTLS
jgi:hypothetical protein